METQSRSSIFKEKHPRYLTSREKASRRPYRMISCRHCGSKIETRAITNIDCPVCGKNFWVGKNQ